jgi:hypothetical protein
MHARNGGPLPGIGILFWGRVQDSNAVAAPEYINGIETVHDGPHMTPGAIELGALDLPAGPGIRLKEIKSSDIFDTE